MSMLPSLSSEDAFLALINSFFPACTPKLRVGRGDDCAVFSCRDSMCVSSDLFLENVHFRLGYFSAEDIGYKALAVNISDIAAMGAKPTGFVMNLMISDQQRDTLGNGFWNGFFQGMSELAKEHDLVLAGGDLSRASCMGVAITIWGEPPSGGRYLQRGQAREGDVLFCIGEIGLARLGLTLLEDSAEQGRLCKQAASRTTARSQARFTPRHGLARQAHGVDPSSYPAAVRAHLRPTLHVSEAGILTGIDGVRGLMDVSDGLARDLPRYLGPNLGCCITLRGAELHPELRRFATRQQSDALEWALLGGEDYALLGSVAEEDWPRLRREIPTARRLGDVTGVPGIFLNEKKFRFQGFDHFE